MVSLTQLHLCPSKGVTFDNPLPPHNPTLSCSISTPTLFLIALALSTSLSLCHPSSYRRVYRGWDSEVILTSDGGGGDDVVVVLVMVM